MQVIARGMYKPIYRQEEPMLRTKIVLIAFLFFVLSGCAGTDVKTTLTAAGQAAVDFTLSDQDGKSWKLSDAVKDYRGVILAFYPKDDQNLNSPIC